MTKDLHASNRSLLVIDTFTAPLFCLGCFLNTPTHRLPNVFLRHRHEKLSVLRVLEILIREDVEGFIRLTILAHPIVIRVRIFWSVPFTMGRKHCRSPEVVVNVEESGIHAAADASLLLCMPCKVATLPE